jgi:hypothetical protein
MICTALVMAAALGGGAVCWPGCFVVTAFSVTDVPLDRSRPRPTTKLLCQCDGFPMFEPRTPRSIATRSTPRTPRYRHGWGVGVLGGATGVFFSR